MTKRVFAVKLGEFVEFRAARFPPRARTSKLTVPVEHSDIEFYFDPNTGRYRHRNVKRVEKKTLKQTFYVGGTVVGTVKAHRYTSRVPKEFQFGRKSMVEISHELKNKVLREDIGYW